jgi:hypothetical protein
LSAPDVFKNERRLRSSDASGCRRRGAELELALALILVDVFDARAGTRRAG